MLDVTTYRRAVAGLQEHSEHLEQKVKEDAGKLQRLQGLLACQTKPSTLALVSGNVTHDPHNAIEQSRVRTNVPAA